MPDLTGMLNTEAADVLVSSPIFEATSLAHQYRNGYPMARPITKLSWLQTSLSRHVLESYLYFLQLQVRSRLWILANSFNLAVFLLAPKVLMF